MRILAEWKKRAAGGKGYPDNGIEYNGDFGVIHDFCSLWQADAEGERPPERLGSFVRGLRQIYAPYSHRNVGSIK